MKKHFGVSDATCVLIGIVVGVGIFRTPSVIAAHSINEWDFLGYWILGGLLSFIGALCYVELSSNYPHVGGEYHFLKSTYGRSVSFLFAWSRLSIIQTGAIATVAYIFGDYISQVFSLGPHGAAIYAALAVSLLTLLNLRGVKPSQWLQRNVVYLTILLILFLITIGLITPSPQPLTLTKPLELAPASSLGIAMIFVLLTFGGWNEAAYISAEVKNPRKNIQRSILLGITLIISLYLLINIAYLKVLGLDGIRSTEAVAITMLQQVIGGRWGEWVVCVIISIACLSTLNATILTGSRTNMALGQDFKNFSRLSLWDNNKDAPVYSLWVQGVIALFLIGLGALTRQGFVTMVEYTAPVFWLFMFLTGTTLFLLRQKRNPPLNSPVPLYPLLPIIFLLSCGYMLYSSLMYTGLGAIVGVIVLLMGPIINWLLGGLLNQRARPTPK